MRSTGYAGARAARVLARIESASPIMLGPWDERRNLTLTDGSNPDFYNFRDQCPHPARGTEALTAIILPLLAAWRAVRMQAARLGRQLIAVARAGAACRLIRLIRLMMTAQGAGALTALSGTSMIEDPANCKTRALVRACAGLAARRCQAGEIGDMPAMRRNGAAFDPMIMAA